MAAGRLLHVSALLPDGRLLVAGGYNRSAELYNPATGTWSRTADSLNTRRSATATLLPNGRVLFAGRGGAEWDSGISSEVYDAASGAWTATGGMVAPRLFHTATLLPDGRVLVTGGASAEYGGAVLSTAEVFDPTTGTWAATAPMRSPRRNHSATLLSNGQVLVVGGSGASGQPQNTAELYDANTGTWSPAGTLSVGRAYHSATSLPNGMVLVVGGGGSEQAGSASAELFHPPTGSWTMTASMARPRRSHSATLLPNGRVLVAGGFHEYTGILTSAEVYEPSSGTWRDAGTMATGRYLHTAALLSTGRVLVAGGFSNGDQASAGLYTPAGSDGPNEPEGPENPSEPAGTSVLLQVIDTAGNPIPGAAISFGGAVFPVDSSGHRLFEGLAPGRFLARVDALGFTSATAVVELPAGEHAGTQVRLLPLLAPIPFQAEQGGTIQTQTVRISIPPNAVVDALGQPVTGTVGVTVSALDPTHQMALMPGPLEGITAASGSAVELESFFMAEVSLWSNGAPVQLAPGKSATLEFILPAALANKLHAGDSVPAWWFDLDAGRWREEGSGTIQPSLSQPGKLAWVVQVNHFTWWNCDAPWTDKSCVNVLVVDEAGVPVPGATVRAEGVSYTGYSSAVSGANGRTCIDIKRGNTANISAGMAGQPTSNTVQVTGTAQAAACGAGTCTELSLIVEGLICTPGAYEECPYSGPAGTEEQGLCRASRRQCNVIGTAWSDCQGEVLPAPESCFSPFDDDCDGQVNEGCACSEKQGQPCYGGPSGTEGVGICHGGTITCGLFGTILCQGQQGPKAELCWTQEDEDCNGVSNACENGPTGWTVTGSLRAPRLFHAAALLPGGKVLISGGRNQLDNVATAEVYDTTSGTWSTTGSPAFPRQYFEATALLDGRVLATGGQNGSSQALAAAEVYEPNTGTWSSAGSMATARYHHTATRLLDGKVLVAGGSNLRGNVATAELYDPATGTWSTTGSMITPRQSHVATLLANGQVLVVGGQQGSTTLATAELYDPATGTWSATGSMITPRLWHEATRLLSGKVLVAGGAARADGGAFASAEEYDPDTGTWSASGSLASPHYHHTMTLLPDGKVLLAGGQRDGVESNTAELYDPATRTWSTTHFMSAPRRIHTATLLPNGRVLVAGGANNGGAVVPAELYTP
ncbi:kelch repeat-containing protein [Hyalangium gracile]|uniref:kelch repeat-containing protein n=1 Tax=Hyalangium gracile TaxID=394092 RepID=UPI001CCF464B|nr:kelch repeat-containing protein [Hyalangium gracile]